MRLAGVFCQNLMQTPYQPRAAAAILSGLVWDHPQDFPAHALLQGEADEVGHSREGPAQTAKEITVGIGIEQKSNPAPPSQEAW